MICSTCGLDCEEIQQLARLAYAAIAGLEEAVRRMNPDVVLIGQHQITRQRLLALAKGECQEP